MLKFQRGRSSHGSPKEKKQEGQVAVIVDTANFNGDDIMMTMADKLEAPRIYVINQFSKLFEHLRLRLEKKYPQAELVCIAADGSQLSEVDRACKQILKAESKIDFLCVRSSFYFAAGPIATSEGPELCLNLYYLSPLRFVHLLEPLLGAASRPRVLIIGLHERKEILHKTDLGMEKKWSMWKFGPHVSALTALAFYRFRERNPTWTLMYSPQTFMPSHTYSRSEYKPFRPRILPGPDASMRRRVLYPALVGVLLLTSPLIYPLAAFSPEESGQRYLNLLTDDRIAQGVWRINPVWTALAPSREVDEARKEGWIKECWDFTMEMWRRALDDAA